MTHLAYGSGKREWQLEMFGPVFQVLLNQVSAMPSIITVVFLQALMQDPRRFLSNHGSQLSSKRNLL